MFSPVTEVKADFFKIWKDREGVRQGRGEGREKMMLLNGVLQDAFIPVVSFATLYMFRKALLPYSEQCFPWPLCTCPTGGHASQVVCKIKVPTHSPIDPLGISPWQGTKRIICNIGKGIGQIAESHT